MSDLRIGRLLICISWAMGLKRHSNKKCKLICRNWQAMKSKKRKKMMNRRVLKMNIVTCINSHKSMIVRIASNNTNSTSSRKTKKKRTHTCFRNETSTTNVESKQSI